MTENEMASPVQTGLNELRERNSRLSSALLAARNQIEELGSKLKELGEPPLSFGTIIATHRESQTLDVQVGSRRLNVNVSPDIVIEQLRIGQQVRLNNEMNVVATSGYKTTGITVVVERVVDERHVLVKVHQDETRMLFLAGNLRAASLSAGDTVLADLNDGFALWKVERPDLQHVMLEEIPDVSYSDIGGLASQLDEIRDSVELPFEQPELYKTYGLKPPKGVLLYGPPGNGKTLIAKAIATSLAERAGEQSYFLNIKGPQLLNKFVGETERQIRELFARARDHASQGRPVVIFFDEMEALFRTRGSGVSSDVETTVVPQLLAEIDGVEGLENVIVVGASNREDMLDPAILRPGRLDIKIRIDRPNAESAADILLKYLTPDLPYRPDEVAADGGEATHAAALARLAVDALYARTPENEVVELTYADGRRETVYMADATSGAMLASIVARAKKLAVKEEIATGARGVSADHVRRAVREEIEDNQHLQPVNDAEEWARVNGFRHTGRLVAVRGLHVD